MKTSALRTNISGPFFSHLWRRKFLNVITLWLCWFWRRNFFNYVLWRHRSTCLVTFPSYATNRSDLWCFNHIFVTVQVIQKLYKFWVANCKQKIITWWLSFWLNLILEVIRHNQLRCWDASTVVHVIFDGSLAQTVVEFAKSPSKDWNSTNCNFFLCIIRCYTMNLPNMHHHPLESTVVECLVVRLLSEELESPVPAAHDT